MFFIVTLYITPREKARRIFPRAEHLHLWKGIPYCNESSYSFVIARRAKAERPTWQSPGTIHQTAQQKQASYREIPTSGHSPSSEWHNCNCFRCKKVSLFVTFDASFGRAGRPKVWPGGLPQHPPGGYILPHLYRHWWKWHDWAVPRYSNFISKKKISYLHLYAVMLLCIWWRLGIAAIFPAKIVFAKGKDSTVYHFQQFLVFKQLAADTKCRLV